MIEVIDLVKRYGDHLAVDHISFSTKENRIYGLLGPNGAGKSTIMNIITGYLAPTSGTVKIGGHNIMEEPLAAKGLIGYCPEYPPLYLDMTVKEYLDYAAGLKQIPAARRKDEIAAALDAMHIGDVYPRLLKNLSKGYRQRVGMAQALLGAPPVLILDEPSEGLDPRQIIDMRDVITELGKTHTVLMSSHILSEVSAVCEEIMILSRGRIMGCGTAADFTRLVRGSDTLTLTVKGPAAAIKTAMQQIERINTMELVPDKTVGVYRVRLNLAEPDDLQLREALFCALSAAACPLLDISKSSLSLEDIFLSVTGEAKLLSQENA